MLARVVVLVTVGIYVEAVHDLNEWGDGDTSGWVGVLHGMLVSLIPLAFIWLGVYVVYVIAKGGARALTSCAQGNSRAVPVDAAETAD